MQYLHRLKFVWLSKIVSIWDYDVSENLSMYNINHEYTYNQYFKHSLSRIETLTLDRDPVAVLVSQFE